MKMLLVAATLMLTLVGCGSDPSVTPVPEGALMAVISRGGLCAPPGCDTTVLVEWDGRVHLAAKPPNDLGVVPADKLAELQNQIATADFAQIRSHPFTGFCPTSFDGQEVVFEFNAPAGIERIESCQVEVDYDAPLFKAVVDAVGSYAVLVTSE